MSADLSQWNWAPNGNSGPAVANLQGGDAYLTGTTQLKDSGSGGGADTGTPTPSGFCQFLNSLSPAIAKTLCPAYQSPAAQQAGADYQGKPTGFTPPPGSPGADVTAAISGSVASIFANKSLWLLAGMILLFVILVMVIRR